MEQVTAPKQLLFIERVFFGFQVRRRQVRHISTARYNLEAWDSLLESSCLLYQILEDMTAATKQDGSKLFAETDLLTARRRAIEG